jgi:hypothetical protein
MTFVTAITKSGKAILRETKAEQPGGHGAGRVSRYHNGYSADCSSTSRASKLQTIMVRPSILIMPSPCNREIAGHEFAHRVDLRCQFLVADAHDHFYAFGCTLAFLPAKT